MKEVTYVDGYAFVDEYKFRKDNKSGYYLSTKKIEGNRLRLHVYMWTSRHGEIPKGYEIHHADENKDNNEIDNLICMTRKEHVKWHAENISVEQIEKARKNIKKAQEKAVEWHRSDEGRSWHQKQANINFKHGRKFDLTCQNCGKAYRSERQWSKFCAPKCQTKFRYDSGVDNEKRVCVTCGDIFEVNKYLKTKTCSRPCAGKLKGTVKRTT